jgi:hypothetical protein
MGQGTGQLTEKLVPVASLQEFFRDSVDAAMATNKVAVDDHTAHYVVNLLTIFSRSEALYESTTEGLRLKPLALMFADALQASTREKRNFALQRLGDVSLFIAGFFADGLRRSPVDLDYYIHMGGVAYHSLSVCVRTSVRRRAFAEVFAELGAKFQEIVDVLNEVRDSARSSRDTDVLRLYESWLKTGSRRAARLLRDQGVLPLTQPGSQSKH